MTYPADNERSTLGSADAPVKFVLWEGFHCPFCQRFVLNTFLYLESMLVETSILRFVWQSFQRNGSQSLDARVAAHGGTEQGLKPERPATARRRCRVRSVAPRRADVGRGRC